MAAETQTCPGAAGNCSREGEGGGRPVEGRRGRCVEFELSVASGGRSGPWGAPPRMERGPRAAEGDALASPRGQKRLSSSRGACLSPV